MALALAVGIGIGCWHWHWHWLKKANDNANRETARNAVSTGGLDEKYCNFEDTDTADKQPSHLEITFAHLCE